MPTPAAPPGTSSATASAALARPATCPSAAGVPPLVGSSPTPPAPLLGGSVAPAAIAPDPAGSSAPVSAAHPTMRSQHGIRKPKTYTDGTIGYGNLATISEPINVA